MHREKLFIVVCVVCVPLCILVYKHAPRTGVGLFTVDPCYPYSLSALLVDPHPVLESNLTFLIPYLKSNGFPAQAEAVIRRERPDPLELPLYRLPLTTDTRCLPEERKSTVHVVNPRDQYTVGDTLRVRVDLYTGYGTRRHFGGDDVRVWLKSATEKSAVVAKVTDLNNGSYLGEAVLKWPGVTLVRASLAHPREYLRALSELLHTIHNLRWNTASFDNGKGTTEKVLCFHYAAIPGFPKVCNLTASQNGDRSWFCSHPVSRGLNCSHWSSNGNLDYLSLDRTPIASVVRPFVAKLKKCCHDSSVTFLLIPNDVQIVVKGGQEKDPPALPPCWSRPRRSTWLSTAHTGWLHKGTWLPDTCSLPSLTKQFLRNCMRNTTLVLLGDSNQRLWWDTIRASLTCTSLKQAGQWHAPRLCQNSHLNASLLFLSHALPFCVGTHDDFVPVSLPRALERLLQHSTPGGKAILVLHYYRHFARFSVHVYRQRVREARGTLEQFVQLHPEVTVIIRGPHAVRNSLLSKDTVRLNDVRLTSLTQIWREEFAGLQDKITFLDLYDLTVAAENVPSHPNPAVTQQLLRVLFGHICEEEG